MTFRLRLEGTQSVQYLNTKTLITSNTTHDTNEIPNTANASPTGTLGVNHPKRTINRATTWVPTITAVNMSDGIDCQKNPFNRVEKMRKWGADEMWRYMIESSLRSTTVMSPSTSGWGIYPWTFQK